MSPAYDLYQPGTSWLHRADPRVKLAFVLCGTAVLFAYNNLWTQAALFALIVLALAAA